MITWIASYPKSGNTLLRLLINAYICNGNVDINNLPIGGGDHRKYYYHKVSPMPIDALTRDDILHLRSAALMNMVVGSFQNPCFIKTHNVNGTANEVELIPKTLTKRAFYIVRDPRNVAVSFAKHMNVSIDEAIEAMCDNTFSISDDGRFFHVLSNWSTHVKSWLNNKKFEVHLIKYERLVAHTMTVLKNLLRVCEIDFDYTIAANAVNACKLPKLKEQENKKGFAESPSKNMKFFEGTTDYRKFLNRKQLRKIEQDHQEVMEFLNYDATF